MNCLLSHLSLLALNTLACAGVYAIGLMWFPVRNAGTPAVVQMLRRPIYTCLVCMASFHSIGFFWFWGGHAVGLTAAAEWGVYMLVLAGANALVERVLS